MGEVQSLSKPERFIRDINESFAGAVDVVSKFMSKQKNASYDKNKVAVSLANVRMALRGHGQIGKYDHCLAIIAGAYAFSKTKQILRVDQTLNREIANSVDESGEIPCSILMNLPYQGFFLELPETETSTIGIFVHMDYGRYNNGGYCYSLWLNVNVFDGDDYAANDVGLILNLPLIEGKSLKEAISESYENSDKEFDALLQREHPSKPDDIDDYLKEWMSIINVILYICSVNADIVPERQPEEEKPVETQASSLPKKVKAKTQQSKPKKQVKVWDVGFRIGSELRKHELQKESEEDGKSSGGGVKRAHLRRAHWHHYWIGSKKDNTQHLILKWIPPIVIHAEYANELPVVMHDVR